jgi:hypothetical protein
MLLLGTRNISSQDLAVGDTLDLGLVYRRYCKKNNCGVKAFDFSGDGIALQHSGIYHVTANITFTAPVAGDVTFQLVENGNAIVGATATETITTATTEIRTTAIDYYVLVDSGCVLNSPTILTENISITNTGVASTVTNVIVNVEKVV